MQTRVLSLALIALSAMSLPSYAEGQFPVSGKTEPSEATDFGRQARERFQSFRKKITDDYQQLLSSNWESFKSQSDNASSHKPKPQRQPEMAAEAEETAAVASLPQPTVKSLIASTPAAALNASFTPPMPVSPDKQLAFKFYEMELSLPRLEVELPRWISKPEEFSEMWRVMAAAKLEKKFLPHLRFKAMQLGLNDYLTYELLSQFVDASFPEAHSSSRASLKHYLMVHLGYMARLGVNPAGDGLVLLAFAQPVYSRPFMAINAIRYYAFADADIDLNDPLNTEISTCRLPSDANLGAPLDLRLHDLNLPFNEEQFEISDGILSIKGSMNANLFPILRNYPRTDVGEIAASSPLPSLRTMLVEQLKPQLEGLNQKDAVNRLLSFVQTAFPYATDEETFGYEKPYFLEESLHYPTSDCEDRAVLYSYLLWNVLGVPNHIIGYPDHETVAVYLDQSKVRGSKYSYEGRDYYISDPTYRGARTGRCNPKYVDLTPEVDFSEPR